MKCKLSEISKYVTDKIDVEAISISQYISTENILEGKKGITTIEKLPNVKRVTAFKKKDILISNIRPYFKKIWFAEFEGGCSSDVLVFRASDIVTSEFLFTLLLQDTFFDQMVLSSKGTKMPRGDKKAIMNLEFYIPNVIIQNKISQILFNIKEKIELNNQIIDTLEEMASALFKRWFVDFEFPDENGNTYKSSGGKMIDSVLGEIPEGWEISSLGKVMDIKSGKRPKNKTSEKSIKSSIPIVGASKIMGYTSEALINESIITTGRVGTHGVIQRFREPVWVSDNSFIIKSKFEGFVYEILKNIDYRSLNRGSTQPLITQTDLKEEVIVYPSRKLLVNFESIYQNNYQMIFELTSQNVNLESVRDTLLPKLLSGEIEF